MKELSNQVGTNEWLRASEGLRISAYVEQAPVTLAPRVLTTGGSD